LHSHQQYMKVPPHSLHSYQHFFYLFSRW
jgi:hypothetical protein